MKTNKELLAERMKVMMQMAENLRKDSKPEDSPFYYHPNEDHIVLSHALFWMMSKPFVSKMSYHQGFLLLHQYEEEMLEAYLTEDAGFADLLDYCNTLFQVLPYVTKPYMQAGYKVNQLRKLLTSAIVAGGLGGDMSTDKAYDLLDDMDFNRYGKVCCPAIERMLPQLNKMMEEEMKYTERN